MYSFACGRPFVCGGGTVLHINGDDMKVISPLAPHSIPPNVEAHSNMPAAAVGLCFQCAERSSTPATVCASPHVIPTSSSNGDGPKASAWPAASPPAPTSLILTTQKLSQRPVSISTRWPLQRWPQQRHQAGGTCSSSLQDFAAGSFLGANGGRPALRLCCHQRQGDGGSTISTPQPAPPELIELVKQPIKSVGGFSSFPLLVATGDELPKPIYKALLRAMPLGSGLCRRHQRWARSILRKLIAYRDGRNAALMRATFDFRPIIAEGLIAEADARSLLVMACSANGYLGKVGIGQVNATISWALEPLEK